jgi:hypothetical protein
MPDIFVQMLAYDEPNEKISRVLESINEQEVPENWGVTREAWITPAHPDDQSFWVAEQHGFTAYESGQGKLTSRNQAHDHAIESGADVIAVVDADAPLLDDDVLFKVASPVLEGTHEAVNSLPRAKNPPGGGFLFLGALMDLGSRAEDVVMPHLHGQFHAISKRAWEYAGPFDTSVDQTDSMEVRNEEEFGFYHRVRDIGDIMTRNDAIVYDDPRRYYCKVAPWFAPDGYCDRRGTKTFGYEY